MYEDFKLPFWCQTRVETVTHERIKKLKNIGLHMLAFGMEHGNEKFRADVIDRKYSNKSAIEALQIPHEYGVPFTVNNIIGFPGETRELAFDTVEINRNWHLMWSTFYFKKKHSGYLFSLIIHFPYLIKDVIKIFVYLIFLNKEKYVKHYYRLLGLFNSMIGNKSKFRV